MRKVFMLTVGFALLILTGCIKEKRQDDATVPLDLKAGSHWASASRALLPQDKPLPAGTEVGVFAVCTSDGETLATTPSQRRNIKYKSIANSDKLVCAEKSLEILLQTGKSYEIYFYSPYVSDFSDPTSIKFIHGHDIMWAAPEKISDVQIGSIVESSATHVMSQVSYVISHHESTSERFRNEYPLSGATISISGFCDSGTLNMLTGKITPCSERNIVITDLNTHICVFPLGEGEKVNIRITLPHNSGQEDKTLTINANIKFSEFIAGIGKEFNIGVRESDEAVRITATIVPWKPGTSSGAIID